MGESIDKLLQQEAEEFVASPSFFPVLFSLTLPSAANPNKSVNLVLHTVCTLPRAKKSFYPASPILLQCSLASKKRKTTIGSEVKSEHRRLTAHPTKGSFWTLSPRSSTNLVECLQLDDCPLSYFVIFICFGFNFF